MNDRSVGPPCWTAIKHLLPRDVHLREPIVSLSKSQSRASATVYSRTAPLYCLAMGQPLLFPLDAHLPLLPSSTCPLRFVDLDSPLRRAHHRMLVLVVDWLSAKLDITVVPDRKEERSVKEQVPECCVPDPVHKFSSS